MADDGMFYGLGASDTTGFAPGYHEFMRELAAYWKEKEEQEQQQPQQQQLDL